MIAVHEINDPEKLPALGPLWTDLLECTPGASFFHSLQWLQIYWKHFGARKRLRVLVVKDGSTAIGILPLVVRVSGRFEPVRVLAYPLDDWGNYYGPIGPDPQTTLVAGLHHIRRTPRDWDFIELAWVDGLADAGRVKLALDNAGFHAVCETCRMSAIVNLAQYPSWDAYLDSRTKNRRKDLRRKEKRLAERGTVKFARYRTGTTDIAQVDPRWDVYEICETLSRASWQGHAKGKALGKASERAYYRDCHLAACRLGGVAMGLLFVDERPVAFNYDYCYRGYITAYEGGYDPAFSHDGIGTITDARSLADSFERGDHTVDLGPGFVDYKRNWLTHQRPIYCYTYFPPTSPAAQTVRAKRALLRWWRTRVAKANGPCGAHAEPQAIMSPAEIDKDTPDRGRQRDESDTQQPASCRQ